MSELFVPMPQLHSLGVPEAQHFNNNTAKTIKNKYSEVITSKDAHCIIYIKC